MLTRRLGFVLGGALALSLALNLFLIGDFAGRASFQPPQVPLGTQGGRLAIVARYQRLPPADRARFRAVMAAEKTGLADAQSRVRQAQAGVLAAMRANPYDTQRVLDAFAVLRTATTARQTVYQQALATALATLTPADREILAGNGTANPGP